MSIATVETAEIITVESLLKQVEQLPRNEQLRLVQLIEKRQPNPNKPPLDKPLPCEQPMPDRTREMQWIENHKHEYAGQWVALDGDRLIAASLIEQEVWEAVKADSATLPLVHRMSSREAIAQWEELKRQQRQCDQRVQATPWPEAQASMDWLRQHSHEYTGQWVALDGDRLIAHGPNEADVWAAAQADSAALPLLHRIAAPGEPLFMGI